MIVRMRIVLTEKKHERMSLIVSLKEAGKVIMKVTWNSRMGISRRMTRKN